MWSNVFARVRLRVACQTRLPAFRFHLSPGMILVQQTVSLVENEMLCATCG
jgi:uncharacterized membrane protein YjjB (DUF3815 family)